MRQHKLCGWAFLLFLTTPFPAKTQESLPDLIKRIKPSVVTIIAHDRRGMVIGQGSGFFVSWNHVVSNRHVLAGASGGEIQTPDGQLYSIEGVVAENKAADLVRLAVDVPFPVSPLSVAGFFPQVGEKVIVVGSPFGFEQTVSDGIVSSLRVAPGFDTVIQITAPFSPGSSGSPVVNLKGEVIGVATRQIMQGQNLNFAVPGKWVLALAPGRPQPLAEWSGSAEKKDAPLEKDLSALNELIAKGMELFDKEDYEKALPYFEKIVALKPEIAEAWANIGSCKGHMGRWEEVIEPSHRALGVKPDLIEAQVNLGAAYANLGQWGEAAKAYEKAVQLKPDDVDAHSSLGWVYGNMFRFQEGLDACRKATRLDPQSAEAYYRLAGVYLNMGKLKEVVVYSKRAIFLKADYPEAYLSLGNGYGGLGNIEDEAKAYREALRLRPDYADAHSNLGLTYAHQNRWPEAAAEYKEAIRLKPDMVEAHYNLGVAYFMTGDKGAALDEYKILQKLNPDLAQQLFDFIYKEK